MSTYITNFFQNYLSNIYSVSSSEKRNEIEIYISLRGLNLSFLTQKYPPALSSAIVLQFIFNNDLSNFSFINKCTALDILGNKSEIIDLQKNIIHILQENLLSIKENFQQNRIQKEIKEKERFFNKTQNFPILNKNVFFIILNYRESFECRNRVGKDNSFSTNFYVNFTINNENIVSQADFEKFKIVENKLNENSLHKCETDYHPSPCIEIKEIRNTYIEIYLSRLVTQFINDEITESNFEYLFNKYQTLLKSKNIDSFNIKETFEESKPVFLKTIIKSFIFLYIKRHFQQLHNFFFWEDLNNFQNYSFFVNENEIFSKKEFTFSNITISNFYKDNEVLILATLENNKITDNELDKYIILSKNDYELLLIKNIASYFKIEN